MPKITSPKCSKMFSLLTPVLLLALALPMAFASMQANIFVSAAHAVVILDPGNDYPEQTTSILQVASEVLNENAPSNIRLEFLHTTALENLDRMSNNQILEYARLNWTAMGHTAAEIAQITTTLTDVVISDPAFMDMAVDLATGGAGGGPVTSSTETTLSVPSISTGNNSLAAALPSGAYTQIEYAAANPGQYSPGTVAFADMLINGSFGNGVMLSQPTQNLAFGSPTEERALVEQFVSKFVDEVFGSPQVASGWSVFLTPYGNFSSSTNGSSHGNTYGLSGGLTHIFNEKFSLGMHFDLGSSQNFADSLSTESRTFTGSLGLNANYKFTPQWYVGASFTASLSNTYNDYKTSSYLGSHSADNNHGGYSLVAALNTGYIFQINKNHALIPEIGLSYVYSHTNANDITWNNGGSFLNMYNDATDYDALYGNISLRWLGTFEIDENSSIKPFVSVGLRQNLSGHNMQSSMVYAGTRYNNESTPDMTTFTTTAGVEWVWSNFSVNLNYNGAYGAEKVNHGGALTLGWSF